MSSRWAGLDPVIPRFCAQTGASLPLAWELAWAERSDDVVVRLTPPPVPREFDRAAWPRCLPPGIRLRMLSGVRLQNTPVPFLDDGGPIAVLFGTDPPAFVEVPEPVGDLLSSGASVADVRRRWQQTEDIVDHLLIGMMRCGLLSSDMVCVAQQGPEGARVLVQEAWVRVAEVEPGVHVLAHTATGNFLKVGSATLQLWAWAGHEGGIAVERLPAKLNDVADRLLCAGMLRAVRA